ncbi:hypothetical protein NEUTE1DRAFT_121271 [Neurospora tetrasperma FGSC 2508]|uniref:non-specific serine/threonine protein kinase n=1 Tax=Neurospora tetrasperma (strain FGSC 2508 / ATCC MYA-4615 / P0657) TaxID=510951 RepID=F8MGQ1_NEUT8|nr:uncharacterized protein NEUTE1DRAFT_121271 [Neurospora tetrasperma FGSC 2508]EGO59470.1 hypothetical protein NEUTE1DRAFT_121271 [Neurospora tetrasperma FGSC 2508]EGZ73595.1 Pkinase-domain-containing protein [Neurospora tetrasperma FGSC 2509]
MATAEKESEQRQPDEQYQAVEPQSAKVTPAEPSKTEPAVRFKSTVEEITPEGTTSTPTIAPDVTLGEPGEVTPEQLRDIAERLKACPLQERRISLFQYEAFSLPASRTPSHEDESRAPSREHTRSSAGRNSPLLTPHVRGHEMHTPPLTPAGTDNVDRELRRESALAQERRSANLITPQDSSHEPTSPTSLRNVQLPTPDEQLRSSSRPTSIDGRDRPQITIGEHRRGLFSVGSGGSSSPSRSQPASRESSPSRALAASQFYTRQLPPPGDANDPYSASKRPAQKGIEPRFIFSRKKNSSSLSLVSKSDKRSKKDRHDNDDEATIPSRNSSMADLKRFFKLGPHKNKRPASPAASVKSTPKTPGGKSAQIPFGDDHGLSSKYGKLGKVLGAGAGGSVRLMKRSEDGVVFAVKEFRPRHSYETEREYVKKLTAEYCMGSSLHHGNIIETLDIVQEKGKWYEVMEYAPYDLFAIVMTGKMSREEVSCCFLQILSGVTYLHSMGLAHRDLKLDNVVVSEHGIMKIIDFGSAHVFRYPFETGIVHASGIVGSDPYLAPEVYDEKKYDPEAVDIWSLAIIYCCMTLRRFPWKVPRLTDNSFKLFAAEPSFGHDPKKLLLPPSASTSALSDLPYRDYDPQSVRASSDKIDKVQDDKKTTSDHKPTAHTTSVQGEAGSTGEKKEVIRGPWRILRLLPRESRHVIGRMLDLDPKTRAKMTEILDDPWVANTVICRQIGPGNVAHADDHVHTLEPPSAPAGTKDEKAKR